MHAIDRDAQTCSGPQGMCWNLLVFSDMIHDELVGVLQKYILRTKYWRGGMGVNM